MKIVTIVGARPQFVKAAIVSRQLREKHLEILVHTGQHYDDNMSEVFFRELSIPKPDYNLGVSGGTHGRMTGEMIVSLENVLLKEKPDACLLYGDTNSTLAGALASVKLHVPIFHVEAGLRFGTLNNPEEVNRVLTDRISSKLFCPTESAVCHLKKEGITENVFNVGNVMYEAYLFYRERAKRPVLIGLDGKEVPFSKEYYYLTCHREENSKSEALAEIMSAVDALDAPVIYPVHPRNMSRIKALKSSNVIFINPVGYLESIFLLENCKKVITDSGGLQCEAFFAGKQCVTLLERELWGETHVGNRNALSHCAAGEILRKLSATMTIDINYKPFGDGNAVEKIIQTI